MARTLIYGSISVAFAALALLLLVSEFTLQGFNKYVLLGISSLMAVVTYVAATSSGGKTQNASTEQKSKSWAFYGKLAFGSYAVAIAVVMLLAVLGLWAFGPEKLEALLFKHSMVVLLALAVAAAPVLWKNLR